MTRLSDFLIVLGNKFSYKSCQAIRWRFGLFGKHCLLSKTAGGTYEQVLEKIGLMFIEIFYHTEWHPRRASHHCDVGIVFWSRNLLQNWTESRSNVGSHGQRLVPVANVALWRCVVVDDDVIGDANLRRRKWFWTRSRRRNWSLAPSSLILTKIKES